MITGVFGYLLAGEGTTGDILTRLPNTKHGDPLGDDDVACPSGTWACPVDVNIARFTIAITVSASYPMLQFVSRACLDDLLVTHGFVAHHEAGIPTHRFLTETVFYVLATTLIAMVEPDVATVMDYIGSTLALLQVFIFPALLLWRLDAPPQPEYKTRPERPLESIPSDEELPPLNFRGDSSPVTYRVRVLGELVPVLSVFYFGVAFFIFVAYYTTLLLP
jgi:hypothetical protein